MLEDIIKEREKKLENIKLAGINPYPSETKKSHAIKNALKDFTKLSALRKKISLVGRIIGLRDQGNLIFLDIKDESGRVQAVLKKNNLGNGFKILKSNLDIGDFIAVDGIFFKTKAGEKSIEAEKANILTKSLRPLPSQWYGLKDTEERFRKRYLDILLNEEAKNRLAKRSQLIFYFRQKLYEEGFVEVETPMLQALPGGAIARPFETHHNALDTDFYLRIAPELYLKRLLVAGYEKVYEIGRVFRNEGIDRDHNPEFTMLELYWAYNDWRGLMKFTKKILKKVIPGKWEEISYKDAIKKYAGKDLLKLKIEEMDEIFKKEVGPKLINPTFVTYYPKSISPLAKSCKDNPEFVERFQLIVDGMEIVNAFSELNDPIDQRKRMNEQEKMYRAGNKEASRLDEDFLEALEYGMPPAAGLGIGIDRLAALITKAHNIKEVIIFPTLRPK